MSSPLIKLLNLTLHDGSRQFLALPENEPWEAMRDHILTLEGTKLRGYVTDHITEVWIDFSFRGQQFAVNNQFGEYWFFVDDPNCPEDVLQTVAKHCATLTGTE